MSLLSEVRTWLLADATIAAQVSTRVRPRRMDQSETLPAIRLAVVAGQQEDQLQGDSNLAHQTLQIDCYADDSEEADDLDADVLARMRALQPRGSLTTLTVTSVMHDGPRQHEEPTGDSEYRYVTGRDYRISVQGL